ncbi:hypothetical protein BDV93DRAFT_173771 [Ceratobasidium sp. AG-I]|nr:hypothetical protein BDV93DRAFT_173771 [Ceratobasidium sp. AG-I]
MSILRQDSSSRSASVGSDEFSPTTPKPTTLRKNQACHQCRKQKRKCDAHRPCKSCVRAHANVIANLVKRGKPFPAHPDCVYDGDSPAIYDSSQTVDLNDRKDLEDKSYVKSPASLLDTLVPPPKEDKLSTDLPSIQNVSDALYMQINQAQSLMPSSMLESMWATNPVFNPALEDIGGYGFVQSRPETTPLPEMPLDLPPMDLVYSLVDVFFAHWPFARQFIHMPTFKQRIRLPPSDPGFPAVSLLHAICALGAVYLPQPGGPAEEVRPGEPLRGNVFRTDEQVNRVLEGMASFGEHQTTIAQIKALNDTRTGKRLLESHQALICVCWWYVIHTRWVDLWITAGTVMRLTVPMGLCGSRGYDEILWGPNFGDTAYPNFKENLLPRTNDFVELETRKRTFWMAFVTDRTHSSATAWPMALDELDIGQSFPYPLEIFEAGIPPSGYGSTDNQKLSSPDILTNHPPELTDDGTLFLKAIELMGRITAFNTRVRTRYSDATNVSSAPAFQMLDDTITAFLQNIPKDRYSTFIEGRFFSLGVSAIALPHVARILLHDPHCQLDKADDLSTQKCLLASRALLNLTYQLQSSSVDFKLFPPTFVFVWAISGKSLLRNYAQSLKNADYANALIYREEVRFLSHSAFRLGENLAIGLRHGLVLQELLDRVDKMYPLPDGCTWPSPMA